MHNVNFLSRVPSDCYMQLFHSLSAEERDALAQVNRATREIARGIPEQLLAKMRNEVVLLGRRVFRQPEAAELFRRRVGVLVTAVRPAQASSGRTDGPLSRLLTVRENAITLHNYDTILEGIENIFLSAVASTREVNQVALVQEDLPLLREVVSSAWEKRPGLLRMREDLDADLPSFLANFEASEIELGQRFFELFCISPFLARGMIARIQNENMQSAILHRVADEFTYSDDIAQARGVAESIPNELKKSLALEVIVRHLCEKGDKGDIAQAREVAADIPDAFTRIYAMCEFSEEENRA